MFLDKLNFFFKIAVIAAFISYVFGIYCFWENLRRLLSSTVIVFLPLIIPLFFKLLKLRFKHKWFITFSKIVNILFSIIFIFYLFFVNIFFIFVREFKLFSKTPSIEEYSKIISPLIEKEYVLKHFPKTIPVEATNYYCETNFSKYGTNLHYVKFNIDDNYLKNIIKNNEKNILEIINLSKFEKYYKHLNLQLLLDDEEKYMVYILKNENNDNNYTSGFVISDEKKEIIFFYANYSLKFNSQLESTKNE